MLFGTIATWWLMFGSFHMNSVRAGTEAEIIAALDEAAEEGTWGYVPLSGPYIDKQMSKNVTGQVGKTAVISCRILYIVGKTVSWMRARDLHLLTVGRFTYTSDDRFKAVHQQGSDDWLLKIHYLQHRDGGAYECQVSTTPPMTHTVWLEVVDPTTWIVGGPDLYINLGSTINLTCEVKFSPEPPPYIFWYHNERLLSYDLDRNGVTVLTENTEGGSISRLIIEKATSNHSGKYQCSPATAPSHSITVHVIPMKDEEPAAIHHKNTTSSSSAAAPSSSAGGDNSGSSAIKNPPNVDVSGSNTSSSKSFSLSIPPSPASSSSILSKYFLFDNVIFNTLYFVMILFTQYFSISQFIICKGGYGR